MCICSNARNVWYVYAEVCIYIVRVGRKQREVFMRLLRERLMAVEQIADLRGVISSQREPARPQVTKFIHEPIRSPRRWLFRRDFLSSLFRYCKTQGARARSAFSFIFAIKWIACGAIMQCGWWFMVTVIERFCRGICLCVESMLTIYRCENTFDKLYMYVTRSILYNQSLNLTPPTNVSF